MLSFRATRLALRTVRPVTRAYLLPHAPRRTFISSAVQTLSEGFLDLAIALPFPPSFPPYSSTIILVTIVSRLVLTVPFSIWSLKRRWRAEEIVMPHLEELRPQLARSVIKEMHQEGIRGTKAELNATLSRRTQQLLAAHRDQLFKEYRCRPITTMLIPPLSQAPLFMGMTLMFSAVAQGVTPLDSESFLTLTSLTHADPTATLPIALGIVTLANVETSRWFVTEEQLEREKIIEKKNAERRAEGKLVVQPKKILQSGLRVLSVGRIIIGAIVPGSVIIYWVTSSVFGLIQTWVFDYLHAHRKRKLSLLQRQTSPTFLSPSSTDPALPTPVRLLPRGAKVFPRPRP